MNEKSCSNCTYHCDRSEMIWSCGDEYNMWQRAKPAAQPAHAAGKTTIATFISVDSLIQCIRASTRTVTINDNGVIGPGYRANTLDYISPAVLMEQLYALQ